MSTTHSPRFSVQGIRDHEDSHRPTSGLNVGEVERYASTIGGTILVLHGLRRGTFGGLAAAILGGSLIYRGATGHCQAYSALGIDTSGKHQADPDAHVHQGRLVKHSITVDRPAAELYARWRDIEAAPKFMSNIESVEVVDAKRSHWISSGPLGKAFSWDSELIADKPDHLIAWKSLPGGDVVQAGSVRFEPATDGRSTLVTIEVNFEPPAGLLGLTAAKILGEDPDKQTLDNLRRFKQLMETGQVPAAGPRS